MYSCMRCVKQCRANARKVNGAMVSIAAMAIKKACSTRKENIFGTVALSNQSARPFFYFC